MGTDTKPCNGDFSKYRDMSTEELEAILGADFLLDGDGADPELVEYILEVITERDALSIRENVGTAQEGWERFSEGYLRDPEERERKHGHGGSRLARRAAGLAAVFAGLLVLGSAGAYAAGIDVLQAIAGWTQETFTFVRPGEPGTEGVPQQLAGLAEELERQGVTEKVIPGYLPEGYELVSEEYYTEINSYSCGVTLKKDGEIIIFHYTIYSNEDIEFGIYQKDNGPPKVFLHNNIKYYLFLNTEKSVVVWTNGSVECLITGIPENEIEKVIESIGSV